MAFLHTACSIAQLMLVEVLYHFEVGSTCVGDRGVRREARTYREAAR